MALPQVGCVAAQRTRTGRAARITRRTRASRLACARVVCKPRAPQSRGISRLRENRLWRLAASSASSSSFVAVSACRALAERAGVRGRGATAESRDRSPRRNRDGVGRGEVECLGWGRTDVWFSRAGRMFDQALVGASDGWASFPISAVAGGVLRRSARMFASPRGARRTLRVGIAGCLAATAIGLGLAGPAAAGPPAATPTPAAQAATPTPPPQAAVPAGDGTGRKIG
jgi:hypothetical protein